MNETIQAGDTLTCRFCGARLTHVFADLGMSPLSNSYLRADQLDEPEPFYPLTARVCAECFLVQLPAVETPEAIFSDYAYFSSYSESWLEHARRYCDEMGRRLGLGAESRVVEIASNDGYLLQFFAAAGIPVLGVEPAANVALAARQKGIETLVRFFGVDTAKDLAQGGMRADLIVANNVLAHVPDLNDFVAGMKILLARGGTITVEFPHLMRLMMERQFDTIYHEHFSYFSLITARRVFAAHRLEIVDVEELATHGGSLRIFARHAEDAGRAGERVVALEKVEREYGLEDLATYAAFAERVRELKRALLAFLIRAREEGKRVVAYGAPAKGNTLLNFCGAGTDFIDYTVDRSPHKQGLFLPGTHIPIFAPDRIREDKPAYVLILPWNLKDEIMAQMADVRSWGGKFVVPIPDVEIIP
ncbi:MAG: methyltransferase domain-containing protein [Thermoanaerobaculia bacterium]